MNKSKWLPNAAAVFLLASGSLLLTGCENKGDADNETRKEIPVSVDVVEVKKETIDITTVLPARTNAYLVAEIRPQVNGTIFKREFEEGSIVEAGQSLYQIDPAMYQAAYNSAKANLASARATANVNHLTLKRIRSLLKSKAVSQQDFDQAQAAASQADAAVMIAQANLDTAKINLDYTKMYSPITGQIGKSTVTEGALVSVGQPVAMAKVQQLNPMYVDMIQSSSDYLRLKQDLANKILLQPEGKTVITLTLENGQEYPIKGALTFSDVSVDETTGSLSLRAEFENPDQILLPGMYVRATLHEGLREDSILIPQEAVFRDPAGNSFVKMVNNESRSETRLVKAEKAIGQYWLITDGLNTGDKIIVSGLQSLRQDKMLVNIKSPKNADAGNVASKK